MSSLTAADMPFRTQDAILAMSLHMAGVPFWEEKTDKTQFPVPLYNVYDEEILRGIKGIDLKGMTLEDATRAAFAAGKKGHVEYLFKMSDRLQRLLVVYKDQVAVIESGEGQAVTVIESIMGDVVAKRMQADEGLMRLCCTMLKMRVEFMGLWKIVSPLIRVKNRGRTTERSVMGRNSKGELVKGKAVKKPGFRLISLNASKSTRKDLKL